MTDRVSANQSMLNDAIKSLATKIPEYLFYTALPQLISRVLHQNGETSKNVALIIRNVLAKYPRQSMWSCGWLRFSKSKEKKKAGDVSLLSFEKDWVILLFPGLTTHSHCVQEIFNGAQAVLRKTERDSAVQNLLTALKK